jgi:hypothetical protein
MLGFNYEHFKEALKKLEQENHARLMKDIEKVKTFVEKSLTMFLESNTNKTMLNYPEVGL